MTRNSRNHNARVRKSQTSVRKRSGVKRTRRRGGRTHTHTTRTKRIGGVLNANLLKNPDWKLYNIPTQPGEDANVEYNVIKENVKSRLRIGYIRNRTKSILVVFLLHKGTDSRDVVSGIYPVVDPKNSTSLVVVKDTSGSTTGLTINKLNIDKEDGNVTRVSNSWLTGKNTISLFFESMGIRDAVFVRLSNLAIRQVELNDLTELSDIGCDGERDVPNSYANRVRNVAHNVRTGTVTSFKNVAQDAKKGNLNVANLARGTALGAVGTAGAVGAVGATAAAGALGAAGVLGAGALGAAGAAGAVGASVGKGAYDGFKATSQNVEYLRALASNDKKGLAEGTSYNVKDIVALLNNPHFRQYYCTEHNHNDLDAIMFVDFMKNYSEQSLTEQRAANGAADEQGNVSAVSSGGDSTQADDTTAGGNANVTTSNFQRGDEHATQHSITDVSCYQQGNVDVQPSTTNPTIPTIPMV